MWLDISGLFITVVKGDKHTFNAVEDRSERFISARSSVNSQQFM